MTEPLVIALGFMADARSMMPQIVQLGADRPVFVLPLAGETVEQAGLAAVGHLPQKFALLGQGLGGDVAIDILRRVPGFVTRIALISTDPLPPPPQAAAAREARLVAARAGRLAQAMADDIPAEALAQTEWRGDVLALVQDMALTLGLDAYVRQSRILQRRPDQQRTLRKARVPALILAGEADTMVPVRRQDFLAGLMPDARLQVIAGAGHLPQLEQPEAVTEALRAFLAGPLMLR